MSTHPVLGVMDDLTRPSGRGFWWWGLATEQGQCGCGRGRVGLGGIGWCRGAGSWSPRPPYGLQGSLPQGREERPEPVSFHSDAFPAMGAGSPNIFFKNKSGGPLVNRYQLIGTLQ